MACAGIKEPLDRRSERFLNLTSSGSSLFSLGIIDPDALMSAPAALDQGLAPPSEGGAHVPRQPNYAKFTKAVDTGRKANKLAVISAKQSLKRQARQDQKRGINPTGKPSRSQLSAAGKSATGKKFPPKKSGGGGGGGSGAGGGGAARGGGGGGGGGGGSGAGGGGGGAARGGGGGGGGGKAPNFTKAQRRAHNAQERLLHTKQQLGARLRRQGGGSLQQQQQQQSPARHARGAPARQTGAMKRKQQKNLGAGGGGGAVAHSAGGAAVALSHKFVAPMPLRISFTFRRPERQSMQASSKHRDDAGAHRHAKGARRRREAAQSAHRQRGSSLIRKL